MNLKRSKLMQMMVVVVVMIGLLAIGLPLAAQDEKPPLRPEMKQFLEERTHDFVPLQHKPSNLPEELLQQFATNPFHSIKQERPNDEWADHAMYTFADYYYTDNLDIYTSQDARGAPVQRTFNPSYDSTPKLNRGSTKIAFISDRDNNNEVYIVNADGSGQTRLTWTTANEYWPDWSPDGFKICFYSYRDGNAEIYVMNSDGTNQVRLTFNAAWDGHPGWSPDGSKIVFSSDRSGTNELWLMNADGSNQHQLTSGINVAAYPAWSPDGERILFNSDFNSDGWLDISIINADGTGLRYWRPDAATSEIDRLTPRWSPKGDMLIYSDIYWYWYKGKYYWLNASIPIQGLDANYYHDTALKCQSDGWPHTECFYPDWETTSVPPSSQINALPAWLNTQSFTIQWFGTDPDDDLQSYDIQYRDGENGVWTDWLTQTTQTSAVFNGQYSHTYCFRSRARDDAYNLETYPNSPDAMTTIYQYALNGQISDNRDQSVAVVNVQTDPPALNAGVSRHDGIYDLYFASGGVYTLTTTRSNFGQLPPLFNVTVPSSNSLPTLYLPPLDNQISDSHFESGELSAWNPSGASVALTPTITSTAHTGLGAVVLGGTVPTDTLTTGPWHSTIEQTLNVSSTIVSGTLSLLYRVASAEPLSDTLTAYVIGANDTLTFTLPLTASEWTHAWFDLSAWNEPTATLKIDFALADAGREATLILDEITWGSAIQGSHIAFLPVARR